MSFKRTFLTFVVFVIVLGAFYWDFTRKKEQDKAKDVGGQVLRIEGKALDRLTLKNLQGEFELVKETKGQGDEGQWKIVKPLETKADPDTLRSLIATVVGARKQNAFKLEKGRKAADYGLEKPAVSVEMKSTSKGEFAQLSIGQEGTDYGQYYAQLSTSPDEVFFLSSSVKSSLDKKLYDLRDKKILECAPDTATTVTLAAPKTELAAEKRDGKWKILRAIEDPGDSTAISDLLRKVDGGRAADFVDTTGTLDLAVYGLDKPQIQFTAWGPKFEAARTLLVGDQQPEEKRYYAKVQSAAQVFLIPEDVYKELTKEFNAFRGKDLFTRVSSSSDVGYLQVKSNRGLLSLSKDKEENWTLADDPQAKVDNVRAGDLAAAYTDLRIKEFLTDSPSTTETLKYGFEKPELSVRLADQDRSTTEGAIIGLIDHDKRLLYAQRAGSPSIFGLEWATPENLIKTRDDLVQHNLAGFKTDDVSSIDAQRMAGGKAELCHFEKTAEGKWKGRQGAEEKLQTIPDLEASSFIDSVTELRYKNKYPADSEDPEVKLAPFGDMETTLTLQGAGGKALLDVGITAEQFDLRFARQPDGVSFSIESAEYNRLGGALDRLLKTIKSEEKTKKE